MFVTATFAILLEAATLKAANCATAADTTREVALAITKNEPERLQPLAVTMSDLVYLQDPHHTIRQYDPSDARFSHLIRILLSTRTEPEFPEAGLVSLTTPQTDRDTDDKACREFDRHVRSDIERRVSLFAKRYRGWKIASATGGHLLEETAVEAIAPAVDLYRDNPIRLLSPDGHEQTFFIRELWRVGDCWKLAQLDIDDSASIDKPSASSEISEQIEYAPAVEFWKSYSLDRIKSSISKRFQMFWLPTDAKRVYRTPLSELLDNAARLDGLKQAVDEVLAEWKREPAKTWGEYERDTPPWLFVALTGVDAKSFAAASQWWRDNRERVVLGQPAYALTIGNERK